jgi:D-glycero-alpha-D-manno-heptose-7-phosphate kinase
MYPVITRAPARIDFVGGWTDVQPFCDKEAGLVVNAACTLYAHVTVDKGTGGEPTDEFIRAACRRFGLTDVRVTLASDAPVGSGLGGSGSVGVALVGALAAYAGAAMTRREIAEVAHDIEIQDLHIIGGRQDQYAAAFGGFHALTFKGDSVEIEALSLPRERVAELQARSVVVYTGQSRVSGNIHAQVQEAFRRHNPDTLDALATIRRAASDFCANLRDGSPDALGELLTENWQAQKRLHPSTTNERVDAFFRIAEGAGALGGKALGAGGGGCLYFLAMDGRAGELKRALGAAGGVILDAPFDFGGLDVSPSH